MEQWTAYEDLPAMADAFEIQARWVGINGWKVLIRKKNVGQPWKACKAEGYHDLTPEELLQVLEVSLGSWLAD